jgi:hypothetical protein
MTKGAFSYNGGVGQTSSGPLKFEWINQQAAQMDDFADCILHWTEDTGTGRDGSHTHGHHQRGL